MWPRSGHTAGRALEWHSRGQRFDPAYLHQDLESSDFRSFSIFSGQGFSLGKAKTQGVEWLSAFWINITILLIISDKATERVDDPLPLNFSCFSVDRKPRKDHPFARRKIGRGLC